MPGAFNYRRRKDLTWEGQAKLCDARVAAVRARQGSRHECAVFGAPGEAVQLQGAGRDRLNGIVVRLRFVAADEVFLPRAELWAAEKDPPGHELDEVQGVEAQELEPEKGGEQREKQLHTSAALPASARK